MTSSSNFLLLNIIRPATKGLVERTAQEITPKEIAEQKEKHDEHVKALIREREI